MTDKAHTLTDKEILKIQRHLSGIYKRSHGEILRVLQKYAITIKPKAEELLKAIEEAKTEDELRNAKTAYRIFFSSGLRKDNKFKMAELDIVRILVTANKKSAEYINKKSAHVYAINYNQIGEGLQKDFSGYEFKPVTESDADKYGELTKQTVDRRKDESWNKNNIVKAIATNAFILYGIDKIFRNTAKSVTEKNKGSANRQASDMMTDAENKGRIDSMYRARDEDFSVKKFWIATLDNRTRDSHIDYDSMDPVELDYEYNVGLKVPRDPSCPFPDEVCNCRCRILYTTDERKSSTRSAREGEVKGSYKNPSSFEGTRSVNVSQMSYEEWMKWRHST